MLVLDFLKLAGYKRLPIKKLVELSVDQYEFLTADILNILQAWMPKINKFVRVFHEVNNSISALFSKNQVQSEYQHDNVFGDSDSRLLGHDVRGRESRISSQTTEVRGEFQLPSSKTSTTDRHNNRESSKTDARRTDITLRSEADSSGFDRIFGDTVALLKEERQLTADARQLTADARQLTADARQLTSEAIGIASQAVGIAASSVFGASRGYERLHSDSIRHIEPETVDVTACPV